YTPQKGGRVAVKNALGRFYLSNGQVLQIHGKTGLFLSDTSQNTGKKQQTLSDNRGGAPSRGELHAVTVTLLQRDVQDNEWPTMTITMNNASFNSETCTIETEAYKDRDTG